MARTRSDADLFGEDEPEVETEGAESDWARLRNGVSIAWLAGFMKMDRKTVKKRLGNCPAISRKSGVELYDPQLALSYLVKPRFDVRDYIKTMNPTELPPTLRKEFWDAENKKMTWMERAGELWHTNDVIAVLAEAFTAIKTATQVWADDVEREAGLNPDQYASLNKRVDALREEIYRVLCEMPKERKVGSVLAESPVTDDES